MASSALAAGDAARSALCEAWGALGDGFGHWMIVGVSIFVTSYVWNGELLLGGEGDHADCLGKREEEEEKGGLTGQDGTDTHADGDDCGEEALEVHGCFGVSDMRIFSGDLDDVKGMNGLEMEC